jgi:hypothetical protein
LRPDGKLGQKKQRARGDLGVEDDVVILKFEGPDGKEEGKAASYIGKGRDFTGALGVAEVGGDQVGGFVEVE